MARLFPRGGRAVGTGGRATSSAPGPTRLTTACSGRRFAPPLMLRVMCLDGKGAPYEEV